MASQFKSLRHCSDDEFYEALSKINSLLIKEIAELEEIIAKNTTVKEKDDFKNRAKIYIPS